MFKDPENMLKGDMAQSLVENLLRAVGNQVYRFGYESILQNLTQVDRVFDRYSDEGEQISSIPDFLVVNKKGRPILIEVKFRWNGMWQKDDIQKLKNVKDFWKAQIILVNCASKPYFRLLAPPYDVSIKNSLYESDEFGMNDVPRSIFDKFDSLVEKYISVTLKK